MKPRGNLLNNLQGIIFDFNGVLLWDDALQRNSWRQFAAQYRQTPLSDAEIDLHVRGRTNRYTLEYLVGHSVDQEEADQLTEQKERIYRQMCLDLEQDFQLSPGAEGFLTELARHQIPRTIATSSGKANVNFFIEHLKLGNWFDINQITYDDGLFPGKPAPDIFWHAASTLKLEANECVVVEDSLSGIQAAWQSGAGHIIALGPKERHESLAKTNGVSQVIENLGQLQVSTLFPTGRKNNRA
jgi:HAD superfamily hydrolase (TIGR01509 family)